MRRHDLQLKPVSHSIAVNIQETASQLTDELPVTRIVYNKVTVKNTDYQAHSYLNRKSEIIVTALPLKHTTRRTLTRVALGTNHAVSGRKSVIN